MNARVLMLYICTPRHGLHLFKVGHAFSCDRSADVLRTGGTQSVHMRSPGQTLLLLYKNSRCLKNRGSLFLNYVLECPSGRLMLFRIHEHADEVRAQIFVFFTEASVTRLQKLTVHCMHVAANSTFSLA